MRALHVSQPGGRRQVRRLRVAARGGHAGECALVQFCVCLWMAAVAVGFPRAVLRGGAFVTHPSTHPTALFLWQDASQGLDDVFIDLSDDEEAGGMDGGDSKLPPPAPPPPPQGDGKGGGGKQPAVAAASNGGTHKQGPRPRLPEEKGKAPGGWRCEGTGVGCGLLNNRGAARSVGSGWALGMKARGWHPPPPS